VDIKIGKKGLVRVRFTQPPEIESKNQWKNTINKFRFNKLKRRRFLWNIK
jgi:hypothetical protein